jgi:hypothetical protein
MGELAVVSLAHVPGLAGRDGKDKGARRSVRFGDITIGGDPEGQDQQDGCNGSPPRITTIRFDRNRLPRLGTGVNSARIDEAPVARPEPRTL